MGQPSFVNECQGCHSIEIVLSKIQSQMYYKIIFQFNVDAFNFVHSWVLIDSGLGGNFGIRGHYWLL